MKRPTDAPAMDKPVPEGFVTVVPKSAFGQHNGPIYEKVEASGLAVRAFRVLPRHLNSAGIVHGGMLATFIDMVLADAIRRQVGRVGFTVRLVTDFAGPAKLGDWVEGRGQVTRETRSLAFVEGELNTGGRKVLSANAIFALPAKDDGGADG